jgi:hypothetical protein
MDARPDQQSISSKRQFNANFTPACRIPPEILSAIFEYWHSFGQLTRNPTVIQVCNFWRETALNTSCLWNRIDSRAKEMSMDFYHRFRFPVHIRWYFEHFSSKDMESAIETGTDPHEFSQVFKHPARILSLDIAAERIETIRMLLARMDGGPAPLLTSLGLATKSKVTDDVHVSELEALRLPMLRTLSLKDVAVPWSAEFMRGPHLRFLELNYYTQESGLPVARHALSVVLATLAGLPNLETLSYWPLPEPVTGAALQLVPMPRLRTLTLGDSVAACATLMRHMSPARPIAARLYFDRSDDDDGVATALWDAAARYWIPNASAPPDAEVSIWDSEIRVRLLGPAPGGDEQDLHLLKYMNDAGMVTHATLRELGPRLARVQTPACLELCVESGWLEERQRFVRDLCGLIPGIILRGIRTLECFLSVLEDGGDVNVGEATFGCLRDLTLNTCTDLDGESEIEEEWESQDHAELEDSLRITNDRISRLIRGLERRRASGATALRSLTLVNFWGLDSMAVTALLKTHDENLQVTVRK